MSQNCGRKFSNGAKFEPRGAVDMERGYLHLKNGLEKKFGNLG
jgi:hypothetical protein